MPKQPHSPPKAANDGAPEQNAAERLLSGVMPRARVLSPIEKAALLAEFDPSMPKGQKE